MEKEMIGRYIEHLTSAKRQCLLALLDYVDALKKNEKDEKVNTSLEMVKKRVHNDIASFYQRAGVLLSLALTGGDVPPFGNGEK